MNSGDETTWYNLDQSSDGTPTLENVHEISLIMQSLFEVPPLVNKLQNSLILSQTNLTQC